MTRPDCRTPDACIAKTPGKHCSGCTLSAKFRDPAFREKRATAFREKLRADPEFRERHIAASDARLRAWRASPECTLGASDRSLRNLEKANAPEAVAARTRRIRERAYAGIPERRWPEVQHLARRLPAEEAKRIVMEDEQAQAMRVIADTTARMQARAAREKREAY